MKEFNSRFPAPGSRGERNEAILQAMEDVIGLLSARPLTPQECNVALACALAASRAAVRVPFPTEDEVAALIIRTMAVELGAAGCIPELPCHDFPRTEN